MDLISVTSSIPYGQKTQTSGNSVTCSFPQAYLEWTSPTEKRRLQFCFLGVVDSGGIQNALGAHAGLLNRDFWRSTGLFSASRTNERSHLGSS
jgi:hypothetical protein